MPRYNYVCEDCLSKLQSGHELSQEEMMEAVFETIHSMNPTSEELHQATICPTCNGSNVEKTLLGCKVVGYIRGDGYKDTKGCHRDMLVHKLETEDPYSNMRQPGEAADLKHRLQKGGQRKPNAKIFDIKTKK